MMPHVTHSWSELWADTRNVFRPTAPIWFSLLGVFVVLWCSMSLVEYYASDELRSDLDEVQREIHDLSMRLDNGPAPQEERMAPVDVDVRDRLELLERTVARLEGEVRKDGRATLVDEAVRCLEICLASVTGGSSERVPRTQGGRWIAVLVGALGLLTFGILTGTIAGVMFLHFH